MKCYIRIALSFQYLPVLETLKQLICYKISEPIIQLCPKVSCCVFIHIIYTCFKDFKFLKVFLSLSSIRVHKRKKLKIVGIDYFRATRKLLKQFAPNFDQRFIRSHSLFIFTRWRGTYLFYLFNMLNWLLSIVVDNFLSTCPIPAICLIYTCKDFLGIWIIYS